MTEPAETVRGMRAALERAQGVLAEHLEGHEAWRALCQLDAREARGETIEGLDSGKLRAYLEGELDRTRPGWRAWLALGETIRFVEAVAAGKALARPADSGTRANPDGDEGRRPRVKIKAGSATFSGPLVTDAPAEARVAAPVVSEGGNGAVAQPTPPVPVPAPVPASSAPAPAAAAAGQSSQDSGEARQSPLLPVSPPDPFVPLPQIAVLPSAPSKVAIATGAPPSGEAKVARRLEQQTRIVPEAKRGFAANIVTAASAGTAVPQATGSLPARSTAPVKPDAAAKTEQRLQRLEINLDEIVGADKDGRKHGSRAGARRGVFFDDDGDGEFDVEEAQVEIVALRPELDEPLPPTEPVNERAAGLPVALSIRLKESERGSEFDRAEYAAYHDEVGEAEVEIIRPAISAASGSPGEPRAEEKMPPSEPGKPGQDRKVRPGS